MSAPSSPPPVNPGPQPTASPDNPPVTPDSQNGFKIIRLGFILAALLGGVTIVMASINGFRVPDSSSLMIVSSVIVGIFAFLAGRKT